MSRTKSHPMRMAIGNHAVQAAEHYINTFQNLKVSWKRAGGNGEHSIGALIQLFSGKPQTSLQPGDWPYIPSV